MAVNICSDNIVLDALTGRDPPGWTHPAASEGVVCAGSGCRARGYRPSPTKVVHSPSWSTTVKGTKNGPSAMRVTENVISSV